MTGYANNFIQKVGKWSQAKDVNDKEAVVTPVTWVTGMFRPFCDVDSGLIFLCLDIIIE